MWLVEFLVEFFKGITTFKGFLIAITILGLIIIIAFIAS
jgi:hypothetical protein